MSLCIGLISGTSADALDAVLLDTPERGIPQALAHAQRPWDDSWAQRILQWQTGTQANLADLAALDTHYADVGAELVAEVLGSSQRDRSEILAIGSHGQTIWHAAERPGANSLQLGDPSRLAQRTGIPVVADFRRADLALGGQGAPLVPAFHAALWQSREQHRAVINLGGIANVTLLPRGGAVRGWDTGPANSLMDAWCQLKHGATYDSAGTWAESGAIDAALLDSLLDHHYLRQAPPKSTGKDLFNLDYLQQRLSKLPSITDADVQRTLLEFTACSVAQSLDELPADASIIVVGGGVKNTALMARLQALLAPREVAPAELWGWNSQWIEAAAFAWLAHRRMHGEAGNLPSVTGASGPALLGGVYLPPRLV